MVSEKDHSHSMWEYFQLEAPETFLGSRTRLIHLVRRSRGKVLNIGIGGGIFEELALQNGLDVHSLDPSHDAVENLRVRLNLGDRARTGFSTSIPFDDHHFDTVVVSELLEHLTTKELTATLAEVHRILNPQGRLVGTVPARENLHENLTVCPHCGTRFHRWGHQQSFDAGSITQLLDHRFTLISLMERPFVPWSILNWKGKAEGLLRMIMYRIGAHGTNENIVFIATPR